MADRRTLMADLYIIAIDTPDVENLQIQYTPFEIVYGRQARVQNINIVGRNDDLHHYISGSTTLNLTLDFYARDADGGDAKRAIKWLESQQYSSTAGAPSRLKLNMGDLFADEIWILQNMNCTYSVFQPANGFLPRYAVAACTFVRDTVDDLDARQIRNER